MKQLTGWLGILTLFLLTYVPPLSTMPIWNAEFQGISLQALFWLGGPIMALAFVWLIINADNEELK